MNNTICARVLLSVAVFVLTFFNVAAQTPTIAIDSIIPNQTSYCTGDTITLYFSTVNFTGTNTFTARMSKSDFALDSTAMGSVSFTGSQAGASITYVFQPVNADVDSGYRLRIRSGSTVSALYPATSFVVSPKPVAVASLTTQTICSGTAFNTITLSTSNNVPGTSYSWSRNNLNVGGIAAGTGNITGSVLTNNTATNQTVTYTIIPESPAPYLCTGNAITVTVIVRPKPIVTSLASDTVCSGSRLSITLTGNVTSTYQWYATDNPNTTGEELLTQTTNPLRDTITNLTLQQQIVFYTVIPTSSTGGCAGDPQTVTITVNPKPVLITDTVESICSGTTLAIALTADIPSTFTWRATSISAVTGESTTLQNSDSIRNTLVNTTAQPQTVVYTVTPVSAGGACAGLSDTIAVTVFPKPAANFNINSSSQCARGNLFTFTATQNAAITAYDWTFGNPLFPSNDTGYVVVESFSGTGDSIPVTLFTQTANSCPDTLVKFINVYPMPEGAFTVSDSTPCSGDTLRFKQVNTANSNTLTWTWGDGTSNTTCTGCDSGKHRYTSTVFPSVRTVRLIATSSKNCRDTAFASIQVKPNPDANFTIDDNSKCFNNGNHQFVFTSTSTIADTASNSVSYLWNFDDNSATEQTRDAVHTYATADSYFVYHQVISSFGCSDSIYKLAIVYLNPVSQIFNSEGRDTLCGERAVTLTAESGYTYLWSTGATTRGIVTVDSSAQIPYTIVYTVTVTDADNCTGASSKAITVIPSSYKPEIVYDTTLIFCVSAKAQVFEINNAGSSVFEWNSIPSWVNGVTGPRLNLDLPDVPYDSFALYIVAVDSLWGCLKSDTVVFRISETTAPTGNIIRDSFNLICTNNTVTSYQWGYDDAGSQEFTLTGETLQSYYAGSDPDFEISLRYYWVKITDAGGCQSKIYYQSPPNHYTSIRTLRSDVLAVRIFPNPAEHYFGIAASESSLNTVHISTATGQIVYHSVFKNELQIDISSWDVGMYIIQIVSETGKIKVQRLVKL